MPNPWETICLRSAMLAGFLLNEGVGVTTYADYSGSGYSMAVGGTSPTNGWPGLLPGESDTSVKIAGANSQLATNFAGIPLNAAAGAVEVVFTTAGGTGNGTLIQSGGGGANNLAIYISGGVLCGRLNTAAGVKTITSSFSVSAPTLVQLTYDSTTLTLYANSAVIGSVAAGALTAIGSPYAAFTTVGIGDAGGYTGFFEKVAIYSECLSAETIDKNYAYFAYVTAAAIPLPYAGNTDIARRYFSGSMKLLGVGDSAMVNYWAALIRCSRPNKVTGFFGGLNSATDNVNWGVQLLFANPATGGTWADNSDGTHTFTEDGGTTPTGDQANLMGYGVVPIPSLLAATLNAGSFIVEADARNVPIQCEYVVIGNAGTGDNSAFYLAASVDNSVVVRSPSSGFIAAGNAGIQKVSITFPLGLPSAPTYSTFANLRMGDAFVTTNAKTIKILNWIHLTTGEIGLELGSIAVGGTSLNGWAATNGIYPDSTISALLNQFGVDTVLVDLGKNGVSPDTFAADLAAFIARMLSLKAGLQFIIVCPYEIAGGTNYGNSFLASVSEIMRAYAVANPSYCLFLDLYHATGPIQKNYVNSGSGTDYYNFFMVGDGVHPSDIGKGRIGEILGGLLTTAAYASGSSSAICGGFTS